VGALTVQPGDTSTAAAPTSAAGAVRLAAVVPLPSVLRVFSWDHVQIQSEELQ